MSTPQPPLVDAQTAYQRAMASGLGHDMALEAVYTAGQHAGRRQADNALNWQTTCLGCAARLDKSYADFSSGEESGYRNALRILEQAEVRPADDTVDFLARVRYQLRRVLAGYEEVKR
jgi:hypothetical protein